MRDYKYCFLFVINAVYDFHKSLSTPEIWELSVFPSLRKARWSAEQTASKLFLFFSLYLFIFSYLP